MLAALDPFQFCAAGVGQWFGRASAMPGAGDSAVRVKSLFPAGLYRSVPGCRLIGVGQDKDPEPLVRRTDFCRREQTRRRRVTHAPKVSEDGLEAEGDVADDIFEEDPFGGAFSDDPGDVWPEVPGIVGAAALSGRAERLAGISGQDAVEGAAEASGVETAEIVPDWRRGEIPCALGHDEDGTRPFFPLDKGAGVIAGLGQHEAQIKASAACAEGQSVPGT